MHSAIRSHRSTDNCDISVIKQLKFAPSRIADFASHRTHPDEFFQPKCVGVYGAFDSSAVPEVLVGREARV